MIFFQNNFEKKTDSKEISIYSCKSQNLTEFSYNDMLNTLLSNFRTTKKNTNKIARRRYVGIFTEIAPSSRQFEFSSVFVSFECKQIVLEQDSFSENVKSKVLLLTNLGWNFPYFLMYCEVYEKFVHRFYFKNLQPLN